MEDINKIVRLAEVFKQSTIKYVVRPPPRGQDNIWHYTEVGIEDGKEDLERHGFGSDILASLLAHSNLPPMKYDNWLAYAKGYIQGSEMPTEQHEHELHRLKEYLKKHTKKASNNKIAQAPVISQQDIGSGEPVAVSKAVGAKIQEITKAIANDIQYIGFSTTVNAPNYSAKSVVLEIVEVYAGEDDAVKRAAEVASQQIMQLKGTIEAALLAFYRTPAGVAILKVSGSPPTLRTVFKIKKQ